MTSKRLENYGKINREKIYSFSWENKKYFCENGSYNLTHINKLNDHEPHDSLSIKDIFIHSSNIGISKIVNEMNHKDIAYEEGATKKGIYLILDKVIKVGSKVAISISEKV